MAGQKMRKAMIRTGGAINTYATNPDHLRRAGKAGEGLRVVT